MNHSILRCAAVLGFSALLMGCSGETNSDPAPAVPSKTDDESKPAGKLKNPVSATSPIVPKK